MTSAATPAATLRLVKAADGIPATAQALIVPIDQIQDQVHAEV